MSYPPKQIMRDILVIRFSEVELKELCDRLSTPFSQLPGASHREKAFELTEYFERRLALERLWDTMTAMRSDLSKEVLNLSGDVLHRYLDSQAKELSKINLGGFVTGVRLTTNLDDIFVDPTLTEPISFQPVISGLNRLLDLNQRRSTNWKKLPEYGKRHIILGALGSGKTCLLKKMFLNAAYDFPREPKGVETELKMPIYLPLRHLRPPNRAEGVSNYHPLIELIEKRFEGEVKWAQLEASASSMLLLCDGLDEIPEELRPTFTSMLRKLLDKHPSIEVFITLRRGEFSPALFDPEDNYYISSIVPIQRSEQGDLIRKLFEVTKLTATLDLGTLGDTANLMTSRPLNEIMTTPLSVVIGVLTYLTRSLSIELVETAIRERIIRLSLGEWDNLKLAREGEPTSSDELVKPADVSCYLAYEAFEHSSESNISQAEVSADVAIQRLVQLGLFRSVELARRDVLKLMSRLCRRSELLDCLSLHNYRFRHKDDVVIMTALYLAEQILAEAREQVLSKRLNLLKWQAVVLTTFDLLFLESLSEADRYISYLVRDGNTFSDEFAYRLYLAACCLSRSDANSIPSGKDVTTQITAILNDKHQSCGLSARVQLAEILGRLGDPRIDAMVNVPDGEFWMGFDQFPNDRPVKKIHLPAYRIDAYPVTNMQFKKFIDNGGYQIREIWDEDGWKWLQETGRRLPRYWLDPKFNKPNYPVIGVSWFEADAYAHWVDKRLPTEQEWEKAARGTEAYYWPWGYTFNEGYLNCSDSSSRVNGTTPVGVYPAGQSPFGVYDMAGNISEWTADWYKPYDPRQSEADSHYGERFKVRRGGGWGWDQDFARCTCRNASPRTADYAILGFRCVS
jgi:formylglycine-generating enzyme required for sulfatase activity